MSSLYLFGRMEDLAYEKPIGHSPRERHHMRFWKTAGMEGGKDRLDRGGHSRRGLDLSHTTEQITHRIAPQVDGERDLILSDLTTAGVLSGTRWIDGFHKEMEGRNGGGDPWQTDGRLPVATLVPAWTLEPAEGGLPEPRAEALSY